MYNGILKDPFSNINLLKIVNQRFVKQTIHVDVLTATKKCIHCTVHKMCIHCTVYKSVYIVQYTKSVYIVQY